MPKEIVNQNWYNLKPAEVMASLNSSPYGLSQEEAQRRLAKFGPNELREKDKISAWAIFLEQFKSALIIILFVAVALSAILGEVVDAILIAVIVFFACGLGFIQEYRAERAMEALKKMAAPTASVLRDGKETEIAARELVPGDIILLGTGNRMPADARIIEAVNLRTDEAPPNRRICSYRKNRRILKGGSEYWRQAEYGVYGDSRGLWQSSSYCYCHWRGY